MPLDMPGGNAVNPKRFPPRIGPVFQPPDSDDVYYNFRWDDRQPDCADLACDEWVTLYSQYSTQWDSFAHVGQVFAIERITLEKKTGQSSCELAYGITSRSPQQADPRRLLEINRGHWTIENSCHYILDWNYDEDRCRIRTGHGPENITRLRRFAIGLIKSKGVKSVAQKMRQLNRSTRLVFDYLRMTANSYATRPA